MNDYTVGAEGKWKLELKQKVKMWFDYGCNLIGVEADEI